MCNEYEELISRAVDHELSKEEENRLVAHLEICEDCRQTYDMLQQMKDWLGQIDEEALPEGFHQQLMAQVDKEKRHRKKHVAWRLGGSIAACMIVGSAFFNQLSQVGLSTNRSNETEQAAYEAGEKMTAGTMAANESAAQVGAARNISEDSSELTDKLAEPSNKWLIQVHDPSAFKQVLIAYLKKKAISFEETESGIEVSGLQDADTLYDWLISQGAAVATETAQSEEQTLILNIQLAE